MAGSFFDGVPEGGDLYLLKSVLHNWDDERCVQILRNCRAAMTPGGRVCVIERVVSDRIGPSARDRAVARSDLNMLVALSGRERRRSEFRTLFETAGLAIQPDLGTAGEFCILQARAGLRRRAVAAQAQRLAANAVRSAAKRTGSWRCGECEAFLYMRTVPSGSALR